MINHSQRNPHFVVAFAIGQQKSTNSLTVSFVQSPEKKQRSTMEKRSYE